MFSAEVKVPLSFGSHISPAYTRLGAFENPMPNAIRIELAYRISMFSAKYNMIWATKNGIFVSIIHFLWPRRSSKNEDKTFPRGVNKYSRLANHDTSSLVIVRHSFTSLDALFSKAPITIVDTMTTAPSSICKNHTPDIAIHWAKVDFMPYL